MENNAAPVSAAERDEKYKNITHMLLFSLIVCIAILVDQITKLLAFYYLPNGTSSFSIIPGWLGFAHEENPAIAYGIGKGNRVFMIIIMIVTAILMVGIPVLSFTVFKKNRPAQVCLAFIEGGAAGNFIDRLFVKGIVDGELVPVVRDFVDLSRFGFNVCNVADFCITFGAVALIFIILFIGPQAAFPLKQKWRDEAKKEEEK